MMDFLLMERVWSFSLTLGRRKAAEPWQGDEIEL